MTREAVALVLTLAGGTLAIVGAFVTGLVLHGFALGIGLGFTLAGVVLFVVSCLLGMVPPSRPL